MSRVVAGSLHDAEVALARLKVADRERRLPTGGTSARSVRAALELHLSAAESGAIELAPRTLLTASIGIADADHESAADLLRDADIALYRAKATGRDRWVRFEPEMQAAV